ncbi:MAG TPA: hypothetical protein VFV39_11055 [Limnobacter sp.]|nr:hypothetical protein [Limnobacter sp.]
MKPKRSALSPLASLMREPQTSSLIAQARESKRLENIVQGWPTLRGVTFSIGPIKQDKLKIFVSTPAALTRLRQSLPSLVEHLQRSGVNVNHIQLQIQTSVRMSNPLALRPKRAVLTDAAKRAWLDLETRLEESPVKDATRALNRHHKFK